MTPHWSVDDLTDHIYGIRPADEHLESCAECGENLRRLNLRRAATADIPEISPAQLARQRTAVLDRAVSPAARLWLWIPAATAVAAVLAISVFVHRPAPSALHDETAAISDAQLFADVYNIEQSPEPLAAAPIHALFEDPGAGQ